MSRIYSNANRAITGASSLTQKGYEASLGEASWVGPAHSPQDNICMARAHFLGSVHTRSANVLGFMHALYHGNQPPPSAGHP